MKVLGLTGGIGSGKTTVAEFFKELGVPVYIADVEAKKLMNSDPELQKQIIDLLGEAAYKNGLLDNQYIASKVFKDKTLLEKVNSLVHPAVGKHFLTWKNKQQAKYVVYEAAILFEKGGYKKCDVNLLITAPLEVKLRRLQARDNTTIEQIKERMNHQWPDEKKAALADFIIKNVKLSETRLKVKKIHDFMCESA